jgi:hypothetical protein
VEVAEVVGGVRSSTGGAVVVGLDGSVTGSMIGSTTGSTTPTTGSITGSRVSPVAFTTSPTTGRLSTGLVSPSMRSPNPATAGKGNNRRPRVKRPTITRRFMLWFIGIGGQFR